jgi:hypothetical protein
MSVVAPDAESQLDVEQEVEQEDSSSSSDEEPETTTKQLLSPESSAAIVPDDVSPSAVCVEQAIVSQQAVESHASDDDENESEFPDTAINIRFERDSSVRLHTESSQELSRQASASSTSLSSKTAKGKHASLP